MTRNKQKLMQKETATLHNSSLLYGEVAASS